MIPNTSANRWYVCHLGKDQPNVDHLDIGRLRQAVGHADEQGGELGHYVEKLSGGVSSSTPDGDIHRNGAVDSEGLPVGGVKIDARGD